MVFYQIFDIDQILIFQCLQKILKRYKNLYFHILRPLYIFLPKMSAIRKDFDENKYMSFLIKDYELLKKCNEIWEKVRCSIKKEFDSESVYNEKYLRTNIKLYKGNINTNFYNNKIPKQGSSVLFYQ